MRFLADSGREEVLRKYSVDRLLEEVDDLYRRLIAEKSVATSHVGRLTTTVAKGRDDADWAGFAREVSENAGL